MDSPDIDTLRAQIAAIEHRILGVEMSDNFCYSNGTIQPLLQERDRLRAEYDAAKAKITALRA